MKKYIFGLIAALAVGNAAALPKAFYVKKGDEITKYNFGVAENLKFTNDGKTLQVLGYSEIINLDEIDYISFNAPLGTSLMPAEQKEKLVAVGQEVYSLVNLHDYADILNGVHSFFDSHYDADDNCHIPPVEYWLDPDYYAVHGEGQELMKIIGKIVKGDAHALRMFKSKVINLYKIEDYYGIYTANPQTEKWEKTPSDHFEIRFTGIKGENFILSLTASADFTTWNTCDFNGQFPKTINITFSNGGKQLCTALLETQLIQDSSIDMNLTFEAEKLKAYDVLKVTDNLITDNVRVVLDGCELVNCTSKVNGNNFVNYDVIYDAVDAAQDKYDEDSYQDIDGDPSKLMALFARGAADADVLGKLQLSGKLFNISRIHDRVDVDSDYDRVEINGHKYYCTGKVISANDNAVHYQYNDPKIVEDQTDCLNSYLDANFSYDGDRKVQGYLGFEMKEEIWDNNMYWDDNDIKTYGYTVLNGYLFSVNREVSQEFDGENWVNKYGPWKINGWSESGEDISITVPGEDVIFPATMYEHEYCMTPLLQFPDQTSFYFEDFFDEDSFSKLIDDYNDIIDTYLSITGQERDDDDD